MGQAALGKHRFKLHEALNCMQSALQLLDDAEAPADVGAHLDLAVCRLTEHLSETDVDGVVSEVTPSIT